MELNHIFNLFGGDPKKYTEEPPSTINIEQFEKTPTFKVGMYKKIILNQHVFQKKLINMFKTPKDDFGMDGICLLYTSPSPRDGLLSRMPSSA